MRKLLFQNKTARLEYFWGRLVIVVCKVLIFDSFETSAVFVLSCVGSQNDVTIIITPILTTGQVPFFYYQSFQIPSMLQKLQIIISI
jgi:hypothetical protein